MRTPTRTHILERKPLHWVLHWVDAFRRLKTAVFPFTKRKTAVLTLPLGTGFGLLLALLNEKARFEGK